MAEKKKKKFKEYKQEFLPPVELKTDPDYPVQFPDMVVAGHKVTPREADIFYTYHTTHNAKLVCEKFGMTPQNLWNLTNRPWFSEWSLSQLKDWLDTARNHWLSNAHYLVEAQKNYLLNPDDYPSGYGQAIAKMIDTLLRASPEGLRPTLVSKFEFEHQTTIKNTVDVNFNITPDKMKDVKPELLDEWNKSGVMPREIAELLAGAVDTDFEDIDGDFEELEDDEAEKIHKQTEEGTESGPDFEIK